MTQMTTICDVIGVTCRTPWSWSWLQPKAKTRINIGLSSSGSGFVASCLLDV